MALFFGIFPIIFLLMFFLIAGLIGYTFYRSIKQERKNDQSPRLTVEAKVIAKRTNFRRSSGTNHHVGHGYTTYYVTFEVASGDRMELLVQGNEYGLLVEGDWGDLSFQGTRFLGFQRKVRPYEGV